MINHVLIKHLAQTHPKPAVAFTLAYDELPREQREKLLRIARALRVPWKPPENE